MSAKTTSGSATPAQMLMAGYTVKPAPGLPFGYVVTRSKNRPLTDADAPHATGEVVPGSYTVEVGLNDLRAVDALSCECPAWHHRGEGRSCKHAALVLHLAAWVRQVRLIPGFEQAQLVHAGGIVQHGEGFASVEMLSIVRRDLAAAISPFTDFYRAAGDTGAGESYCCADSAVLRISLAAAKKEREKTT
jgi:hypothetical protein